jgi:hypothetical protein
MSPELQREMDQCLDELERGELSPQRLREMFAKLISPDRRRQDLLYIQAASSSVAAPVQGMLLVEDGKIRADLAEPADWPYQSVLHAMGDGWRVIQFPNLALMLDESRSYGLGCEFILERYR